jgi:uncharacterized protein YndB with AHSA1/START domain
MSKQPYVIERVYNAPVSAVWQAISNDEEMKKWYFELPGFKPEVGYRFTFTGGHEDGIQYTHLCEVTSAIRNEKLSYTWAYDGYEGISEVIFELFAEGDDKTRLRLTHTGIDTFPANPDFAASNFAAGWEYIIGTALQKHLDGE